MTEFQAGKVLLNHLATASLSGNGLSNLVATLCICPFSVSKWQCPCGKKKKKSTRRCGRTDLRPHLTCLEREVRRYCPTLVLDLSIAVLADVEQTLAEFRSIVMACCRNFHVIVFEGKTNFDTLTNSLFFPQGRCHLWAGVGRIHPNMLLAHPIKS